MSRDKPPAPAVAPPVVSTGCSGLMSCSFLSRHRRRVPQHLAPAPARRSDADGGAAFEVAERCLRRVRLLEEEVKRLSLTGGGGGHEARTPAPRATERGVVVRGHTEATDRVAGNNAKATAEGDTGTAGAGAARHAGGGHGAHEVVRLEDGSYMRELRRVGRPWERLAVQVSRPAVPADAESASEVLGKMAAMRPEDLWKFLFQLMPLKDITGQKSPGEPVRWTARTPISGDDLAEALVLDAMGKLEYLVLEGLKIQMASPAATEPATAAAVGDKAAVSKDCMVYMVLMQARDPMGRYRAIGKPMIGLIEVSLELKDASATVVRRRMLGLHVAGISSVMRRPGDGRCVLWSAHLKRCKGSYDGDAGGDGCRCICVRNPDRVFKR